MWRDKESTKKKKKQRKGQNALLFNLTRAAVQLIMLFTVRGVFHLAVLFKTTSASPDKLQKEEIRKPQTILSKLNIYHQRDHAGDSRVEFCQNVEVDFFFFCTS